MLHRFYILILCLCGCLTSSDLTGQNLPHIPIVNIATITIDPVVYNSPPKPIFPRPVLLITEKDAEKTFDIVEGTLIKLVVVEPIYYRSWDLGYTIGPLSLLEKREERLENGQVITTFNFLVVRAKKAEIYLMEQEHENYWGPAKTITMAHIYFNVKEKND